MGRFEYWARKIGNIRAMYRASKVEWGFINERLRQPVTWTGKELGHVGFWAFQVIQSFFFVSPGIIRYSKRLALLKWLTLFQHETNTPVF